MRIHRYKDEYFYVDQFRSLWKLTPTQEPSFPFIVSLIQKDIPREDYETLSFSNPLLYFENILNKYI